MKTMKMTRVFEGEEYHFCMKAMVKHGKRDAQRYAALMRKMGHKARVIKGSGLWEKYWCVFRTEVKK
jgi:hypothetical protein